MKGFTGMQEMELASLLQKWNMKDSNSGRTTAMLENVIEDTSEVASVIIGVPAEDTAAKVIKKLIELLEEKKIEYTKKDGNRVIVGSCTIDVLKPDTKHEVQAYDLYYEDHTAIESELMEFMHTRIVKRHKIAKEEGDIPFHIPDYEKHKRKPI